MKTPTNRFFYSEKQATINGANDANEVFNGKEWVKYSEWVSKDFMHCTCNWDDAVLVYETADDNPQIEINPIKHEMSRMFPEDDDIFEDYLAPAGS